MTTRLSCFHATILSILIAGSLHGGVVVTTSGVSFVGTVRVDTNRQIHVTRADSELILPQSQIVWGSTSADIRNKLDAAKEAIRTRAPAGVARRLLQASMTENPETRAEAMRLHAEVVLTEQAAQQGAANDSRNTDPVDRPHRNVGVTLSIEKTDLQGWHQWGQSGSPYSSIRTPIFSTTRLNTSGILRAD